MDWRGGGLGLQRKIAWSGARGRSLSVAPRVGPSMRARPETDHFGEWQARAEEEIRGVRAELAEKVEELTAKNAILEGKSSNEQMDLVSITSWLDEEIMRFQRQIWGVCEAAMRGSSGVLRNLPRGFTSAEALRAPGSAARARIAETKLSRERLHYERRGLHEADSGTCHATGLLRAARAGFLAVFATRGTGPRLHARADFGT